LDGWDERFKVINYKIKISGDIVVLNLFIYVLLSLCGNSIGLWAGCIFNDPKVATSLMPLFVMPIVLFSGFFKNQGNFMSWVDWI
jgi:hypothetical protein